MNKELLIYFFNENWILFAGLFLASIMTYTSFISSRFSSLSAEQAVRFINDGAWIVDTRAIEDFRRERIDGAANIPSADIVGEIEGAFKKQKSPKDILFYCSNGTNSIPTIKKLKNLSLETNYHYLQGGINAWKTANYPISKETSKNKKK